MPMKMTSRLECELLSAPASCAMLLTSTRADAAQKNVKRMHHASTVRSICVDFMSIMYMVGVASSPRGGGGSSKDDTSCPRKSPGQPPDPLSGTAKQTPKVQNPNRANSIIQCTPYQHPSPVWMEVLCQLRTICIIDVAVKYILRHIV
eukprot:673731-Pyramimonas_sp.AAC.1